VPVRSPELAGHGKGEPSEFYPVNGTCYRKNAAENWAGSHY
jgi:hypothetical protein